MTANHEALVDRLVAEFGYPRQGAELIARRVGALMPPVRAAFAGWLEDGAIPDLAAGEFTVRRLMDDHRMNPVAALLTLDWLLREPQRARESLAGGHDEVGERR